MRCDVIAHDSKTYKYRCVCGNQFEYYVGSLCQSCEFRHLCISECPNCGRFVYTNNFIRIIYPDLDIIEDKGVNQDE